MNGIIPASHYCNGCPRRGGGGVESESESARSGPETQRRTKGIPVSGMPFVRRCVFGPDLVPGEDSIIQKAPTIFHRNAQ